MAGRKRKVVTAAAPEVLYHGTGAEIEGAVRPFTHFGTFRAALTRACRTAYGNGFKPDMEAPVLIYPAQVGIAAAMVTEDLQGEIKNHSPNLLAAHLHYDAGAVISSAEFGEVIKAVQTGGDGYAVLGDILKAKGWDGIAYTNDYEDRHSLSWIVLNGDQATLGEPIRLTLGEALRLHDAGATEPPVSPDLVEVATSFTR